MWALRSRRNWGCAVLPHTPLPHTPEAHGTLPSSSRTQRHTGTRHVSSDLSLCRHHCVCAGLTCSTLRARQQQQPPPDVWAGGRRPVCHPPRGRCARVRTVGCGHRARAHGYASCGERGWAAMVASLCTCAGGVRRPTCSTLRARQQQQPPPDVRAGGRRPVCHPPRGRCARARTVGCGHRARAHGYASRGGRGRAAMVASLCTCAGGVRRPTCSLPQWFWPCALGSGVARGDRCGAGGVGARLCTSCVA